MKLSKTIVLNGKLFITDEQEHSNVAVQQDRVISERDYGYFMNAALQPDDTTFAPQQHFVFELTDPEGASIDDGGSVDLLYESVPETSFVYEEPISGGTESE